LGRSPEFQLPIMLKCYTLPMKLLLVIAQDADAGRLQQALVTAGFRATKLASTGGFLRDGNSTFIIGVNDEEVEQVKEVVRATCRERMRTVPVHPPLGNIPEPFLNQPIDVVVGGAIIFVLNVEAFERL
jgi:uncharacterized protein YaaQ